MCLVYSPQHNICRIYPYRCGLPRWLSGKESACQCRRHGFDPWVRKMPWRRKWQPTPVFLPGESHGRRSLVGCSPWGREESDTTERLHFDFSLSYIGKGNGNPLQCSCLENPRDGGAWWAAIYGVAQSRTRLKQLSSSSWKKERATHYSVLAWRIPGMVKPGGLPSMGLHRVRHD